MTASAVPVAPNCDPRREQEGECKTREEALGAELHVENYKQGIDILDIFSSKSCMIIHLLGRRKREHLDAADYCHSQNTVATHARRSADDDLSEAK